MSTPANPADRGGPDHGGPDRGGPDRGGPDRGGSGGGDSNASPLHVLQTVGSLVPSGGGPTRSVPGLCTALAHLDQVRVSLLCCRPVESETNLFPDSTDCTQIDRCHLGTAITELQNIDRRVSVDVLHDHGMWLSTNRATAKFARQNGIKRVLTPRGMLSPWALNHHRYRKKMAWHWFAGRDVRTADLLHATSDLEAEELRRLGLRNPIAIIPNGVDVRPRNENRDPPSGPPTALFLSRIHEKKGIGMLLDVWQSAAAPTWRLIIAGPDPQKLLEQRPLPARCAYIGPVEGDDKQQLFETADLFILPSHSENFGIVIAEALAASVPVITTTMTPWSALGRLECGWCIPPEPASLRRAIESATTLDRNVLRSMGERGREHIKDGYDWPSIGRRMNDCYRWLLGRDDKPDHVHVI